MCDLTAAFAAIDETNAADPQLFNGLPLAQVQGRLASGWLARLEAGASPELQLAVRAHHLRRWEVPRGDFPAGRGGYLRWRRTNKAHQADSLAALLETQGWPSRSIERTRTLLSRSTLGTDDETQRLEDVACLVFLETQFETMTTRLERDHLVAVATKTLKKMSPAALSLAASINLNADSRDRLAEAVARTDQPIGGEERR